MLSLCFWVTLLFAILYAMASMDVTGQCYCDPCSSSSPAITNGLSIVTAMGAFLFIAQVVFWLSKNGDFFFARVSRHYAHITQVDGMFVHALHRWRYS